MTDERTGKQYIVLPTTTLIYDINQKSCEDIGAHLPEPKDQQENYFLNSLGSEKFVLGIKKVGQNEWVFDSDGSAVNWFPWASWDTVEDAPRGGAGMDCVAMLRNHGKQYTGSKSQDWFDIKCGYVELYDKEPTSLICQKSIGE